MERFQVIDADGHVEESAASLQKYLKKENRGRPLWTSDAWDRDFGKTLGKSNQDPHVQLADMDVDGIDVQVIYPTRGISLSAAREVDLAVDIARAYNDWLAEFCSTNPATSQRGCTGGAPGRRRRDQGSAPRGGRAWLCRGDDAHQCAGSGYRVAAILAIL